MRIIIVSGGFDPLHIGHLDYLERSKDLGDKLIVIVNRNHFLVSKKGYVFMDEKERLRIINSLKVVDLGILAIDEDNTVNQTLLMLANWYRDDEIVFAKGGDRNVDNIPEKDVCNKMGIKIVDGLGEKIRSSSDLIKGVYEYKNI